MRIFMANAAYVEILSATNVDTCLPSCSQTLRFGSGHWPELEPHAPDIIIFYQPPDCFNSLA